jgi:transposase
MIPSGARVLVATKPVDFRKGPDGLVALVRDAGADPFSGVLYVFRSKRADRVKIVWWDGTGLCLFAKRLDEDRFRWPRIEDGVIRLSGAQLQALVEGMDWRRVHLMRVRRPQSAG